jgi:hypothetical protein
VELLLSLLFLAALPVAMFGPTVMRRVLQRRIEAGNHLADDLKCWMCGAPRPELVASEVFRCRACERLQGEGAVKYLLAERRTRLSQLPQDSKLAKARQILDEVALGLEAAGGELTAIAELTARHQRTEDLDPQQEIDASNWLASALLRVATLESQLHEVALLLGQPEGLASVDTHVAHTTARETQRGASSAQVELASLYELHARLSSALAATRPGAQ